MCPPLLSFVWCVCCCCAGDVVRVVLFCAVDCVFFCLLRAVALLLCVAVAV